MNIVKPTRQSGSLATADAVAVARRERLERVSEQFEALFLQQILKQMHKAGDVLTADSPLRSRQLDTLRDFHDEALADTLASRRQTGIADMLVKQLSGVPAATPLPQLVTPSQPSVGDMASRTYRDTIALVNSLFGPVVDTVQQGLVGFKALVDRVIANESAGQVAAISPRGARGLMQLMPDTARDMARELNLEYDEHRLISDAAYNKTLGSAYLKKMLDRYDGEHALALAAYNAGPGRVDEWLVRNGDPRQGQVSVNQWVAQIPFAETRLYTRKILSELQAKTNEPAERANAGQPSFSAQTLRQIEAASRGQIGQGVAATSDTGALADSRQQRPSASPPINLGALRFKVSASPVALNEGEVKFAVHSEPTIPVASDLNLQANRKDLDT
jgi:soluble lytic murein transglycosylase